MKVKPSFFNNVARVFIGSSTEYLTIAKALQIALRNHAEVCVWDDAFPPGQMLLSAIVNSVSYFDFGVFILSPDDVVRIRNSKYSTVRDNVLFEAGVFMGGLGLERTFFITANKRGLRQRTPSDLAGIVTAGHASLKGNHEWDLGHSAKKINQAILHLGPAPRNPYNEILSLKSSINEQNLRKGKKKYLLGALVKEAAAKHPRRWVSESDPRDLMDAICKATNSSLADDAYWWLVVRGVFMFYGIDHFTSSKSWHWTESIEYVSLSERGVALLNQLRWDVARKIS